MAEAVRQAQSEGGVKRTLPSALDLDKKRKKDIKRFFEELPVYREASPLIAQLYRKSQKKKWKPTDEELSIFFATVREIKRRAKRAESVTALIEYEESFVRPSALDESSFDLLD